MIPYYPLIGLAGYKGSGKSTAARILSLERGYVRIAFADKLKQAAKLIYNLSNFQLYGNDKDIIDSRYNLTPRYILQRLGMEVCRNIYPDTWINIVEKVILDHKDKYYVIDDVRYPNEVALIHRLGGKVWLINRSSIIKNDMHASEQVEALNIDYTINNNSTIENLTEQVLQLEAELYEI